MIPNLTIQIGFFVLNKFGMSYGDGRVCKTLAGEFESRTSHQMFRSTSGLCHHPFKVELSEEGHGFESRTEYKNGPIV